MVGITETKKAIEFIEKTIIAAEEINWSLVLEESKDYDWGEKNELLILIGKFVLCEAMKALESKKLVKLLG